MDGNIPRLSIIIPRRMEEGAELTLKSLATQTFKDFSTIVVPDEGKGASWARNEGFKRVESEYVLFSDNDIDWKPNALEVMMSALRRYPKASYAYGRYKIGDLVIGHKLFDPIALLKNNYISTMSIIRSKDFCGFDEKLKRFQDWDLWLTMTKQGKRGVYCNELIFETPLREGISIGGQAMIEALKAISDKHFLNLPEFQYV